MIESWENIKIKDFVSVTMGQSPESKYYNTTGKGLPFLQGNRTFGSKYPSFDTYCSNGNKFAERNDILISVRAPVGDLNVAKEKICIGRGVAGLRMKNGNFDFLYYLMKANINKVIGNESGTVFGSINKKDIENIEVSIPKSSLEQRAIAEVLSALDDKIELNRRMNQTLEQLAQALFKHWFIDNPESEKWEEKPLDEVATFLNGLALQKFPPIGDNYLPVIKIAQLRTNNSENADKASAELDPAYVVNDGDVLFSWSGSLAVVLWCGGKGALNQHLFKVTSKSYPKWFYYYWIKYHLPYFQEIAAGKATTMGHIQRHHLSEAIVCVPSKPELDLMSEVMAPLVEKIIANNIESRTLAELRDTLLPKLMAGQVHLSPVTTALDASSSVASTPGHEAMLE